jgi:hypothetical protein
MFPKFAKAVNMHDAQAARKAYQQIPAPLTDKPINIQQR